MEANGLAARGSATKRSAKSNIMDVEEMVRRIDGLKIADTRQKRISDDQNKKGLIPRGLNDCLPDFDQCNASYPLMRELTFENKHLGHFVQQINGCKPHRTTASTDLPHFNEIFHNIGQNGYHGPQSITGQNRMRGQNEMMRQNDKAGQIELRSQNNAGQNGGQGQNRIKGQNGSIIPSVNDLLTAMKDKHEQSYTRQTNKQNGTVINGNNHCAGQNERSDDFNGQNGSSNKNGRTDVFVRGENQRLGVERLKMFLQNGGEDFQPPPYSFEDIEDLISANSASNGSTEPAEVQPNETKKKRPSSKEDDFPTKQPRYDDERVEDIRMCRKRLMQSIHQNDLEATRSIFEEFEGTDVFRDFLENGGAEELLKFAAREGNVGLMRLLLDHGLDPNTDFGVEEGPFIVYKTPVHLAASQGNLHMLQLLLDHPGVHIDKISTKGMTALHHAVRAHTVTAPGVIMGERFDNSRVILTLVHHGACVSLKDSGHGRNFFHHLVETGDTNLMRKVFNVFDKNEITTFLNTRTTGSDTCYHLAHKFKNNDVIFQSICELLREYQAECKPSAKKH